MRIPACWDVSKSLKKMAIKIFSKFEWYLEGCEIDKILFMTVTDTHARWFGKVYTIREPFKTAIDIGGPGEGIQDVDYIIAVNMDIIFDNFKLKKERLNVAKIVLLHELRHVFGEGKLRHHNVEDFSTMLEHFGVQYLLKVDVPNILSDEVPAVFRNIGKGKEKP